MFGSSETKVGKRISPVTRTDGENSMRVLSTLDMLERKRRADSSETDGLDHSVAGVTANVRSSTECRAPASSMNRAIDLLVMSLPLMSLCARSVV